MLRIAEVQGKKRQEKAAKRATARNRFHWDAQKSEAAQLLADKVSSVKDIAAKVDGPRDNKCNKM